MGPSDYHAQRVVYLVPAARFSYLLDLPEGSDLGKAVNEAMRRGLAELDKRAGRRRPFHTRTLDAGECLLGNVDDVSAALAHAEGEDHR